MRILRVPPLPTFLAIAAVTVLISWRALEETFRLAWNNEGYTHILLIVPIAVGLIYLDWDQRKTDVTQNWRGGSILLVAAVALGCFARWSPTLQPDVRLTLTILALVVAWIGAFLVCFGTAVARMFAYPLCFLFWLVPFPTVVLQRIIALLQIGSAYAAQTLFICAGVPVTQDGVVLTIPGLTLEVAQECSSVRSSMMLLVTTMVLAQLVLRSPWRKAVIIAVAIPLTVAKNGLRIFTIAMLGTKVDPGYLTGRFHHHGGIVFLTIAILVIFLLLWLLREDPRRQAQVRYSSP